MKNQTKTMNPFSLTQEANLNRSKTFSLPLMRAAFEDVQNPQDWREPISATISAVNQELTRQAVIWFTGTEPTFEPIAKRSMATGAKLVRVTATGYRMGPCGDQ